MKIGPVFSERTFADLDAVVREARLGRTDFDPILNRFGCHNLPPLVDVHRQMAEQASDLFGVRLQPSYVYLSQYLKGGRLLLHLDRPQCFRTIDVLIAQDNDVPWPIRISSPITDKDRQQASSEVWDDDYSARIVDSHEWVEVSLKPNEAVCYSGTHQWHYRPGEAMARTDLIFFHFAPEDFDGPLD